MENKAFGRERGSFGGEGYNIYLNKSVYKIYLKYFLFKI